VKCRELVCMGEQCLRADYFGCCEEEASSLVWQRRKALRYRINQEQKNVNELKLFE
jgi:hypothetical protein